MKKKVLNVFFLTLMSLLVFTGCSKDEEVLPLESEVAGTYKGSLDITVDGISMGNNIPKNISITKSAGNKVNLELKDFVFMNIPLGTITLSNCEVKLSGKTYSFDGNQTLTSLPEAIGECLVEAEGTIVGQAIALRLNITVKKLNQKVLVVYSGNKLSGSESAEAKILSFTFDSNVVTEQPTIDETAGTIVFKVSSDATAEQLKLTPTIAISDKAVMMPATGVTQDFSNNNKVTYTVIAENGTVKEYKAFIEGTNTVAFYDFEEWGTYESDGVKYYDYPMPKTIWASSAEGAMFLSFYGIQGTPIYKSEDKKNGSFAVKMVTMDTSEYANALVPAITAGSLYTGVFDLAAAMTDRLSSTKFGLAYTQKPLFFRGWYKYTPGTKYIDGSDYQNIKTLDQTDQCAIQAVLYKITDDAEVLTGHDLNNSAKRVAVAQLADGTAKAEYTYFDIPFTYLNGQSYEAGAKYKLAIVCSSSKDGDTFKGAGGSTLLIDDFCIVAE